MINIRKIWICLFSVICLSLATRAQSIGGTWNGTLQVQTRSIPIVFHIATDSSGKWIATFDSPSQNAFNLPVSEVITKSDSVILMLAILNGKYTGILSADKKAIDGQWFQGNGSLPLTMSKTSDTGTVKKSLRPQTPTAPFPYQSKEVAYWNADKTIQYGATLTYPTADPGRPEKNKFPAVILITGSGQQDRDEMLFGHKPFAVIADHLNKKGFLVMRVDDRGMGKTTGNFSQATIADFVKDVEAGLDFLEAQPETDKDHIGLIGHSEGGLIAPIVADERKEVKFLILLAGPGIPIIDLMQQQAEAVDISNGRSIAEARATSGYARIMWEEIIKNEDSSTTLKNIRTRADAWTKTIDTATQAKIKGRIDFSDDNMRPAMAMMTSKWFRYFISSDPTPYLLKLHCKVLALNGSRDVQVISNTNLAGLKTSLKKSSSPQFDVIELPGLNHLFQTCVRCNTAEYGELEETFSPTAFVVIDDWLSKNVLSAAKSLK